jgi:Ca2+-binding EF-hand superfamily protein
MQSEELARNIFSKIDFNFSGFLNWDEFLDLMVIIRAKTLNEKIDLFIKIADEDGNKDDFQY